MVTFVSMSNASKKSEDGSAPAPAKKAPKAPKARGPAPLVQPVRAAAAWRSRVSELAALAADKVRPAEGVDVPRSVTQALAALPKLRSMRDEISAALPQHPKGAIDALEELGYALWFAEARVSAEHESQEQGAPSDGAAGPIATRARALRDDLLVSAEPLARKGLLDANRVSELRAEREHDDPARDLAALFDLYTWAWGDVQNKTAVTQEDIAEAGSLAQKLMALEARDAEAQAFPPGTDAKSLRDRAFTLFSTAYEESLRAVTYVRWHQHDAHEVLAPMPTVRKPRATGTNSTTGETPEPTESAPASSDEAPTQGAEGAVSATP